jgi:hypothetical protein
VGLLVSRYRRLADEPVSRQRSEHRQSGARDLRAGRGNRRGRLLDLAEVRPLPAALRVLPHPAADRCRVSGVHPVLLLHLETEVDVTRLREASARSAGDELSRIGSPASVTAAKNEV